MVTIIPIEKVREALKRAEDLGAANIEEACVVAADALQIAVESVREVAFQYERSDVA